MRAKITRFSTSRKRRINLGDYHGVEFDAWVMVELAPEIAQVSFDATEDAPGFDIEFDEGETLPSLIVKVQGLLGDALEEVGRAYNPYMVPLKQKSALGIPIRVKETFQGSPVENE